MFNRARRRVPSKPSLGVETLEARVVPAHAAVAYAPDVVMQRRFVGDFNGDSKSDVATLYPNGQLKVGLSDGTRVADPDLWANWAGLGTFVRVYAADFNGDEDGCRGCNKFRWFVSLSNGQRLTPRLAIFPPSSATLKTGDFNGDGEADVAGLTLQV